ncbi:ERAP1-like C-terminal domain-containing protein [Microbulbifer agarilyticus]|uniref:M1 family metallopeptidase n=1 Tax=Microbulbifer agarilyticus TaxID=260552 RepID=UPI001C972B50|nr:M1 family metallopeptidase [Microbulbifer agarilyticus]MBY6190034.1 ERAP1-like C-terminal domain-containing protein [Microbulbifer agarilyticus]
MQKFALPALLAGLILLTACGSDKKNTEDTPSTEPAAKSEQGAAPEASEKSASQPQASTNPREQAPAGRLPDDVRPTAYRLDLTLDPRQDTFYGQVDIDIELDKASDHIWIHGNNINVSDINAVVYAVNENAAANAEGEKVVPAEYKQVLDSGVVRVDFGEEIPAGKITLRIQYSAPFDKNLAGLFKVEEKGDAYALAKSESIQARRFLPGFDEPGLKATYDISLTVPEGYEAISNEPETARNDAGNGMQKVTFAQSPPMPTYLLSLAVGPFDVVERPAIPANQYRKEPLPLRGFARKGRGKDLQYVLDITPQMLRVFEEQIRRPYPFRKLDIIAAPQWPSGATELSAAITYREQRILVDGDEPAPGQRLALLGIHAHEIAHMWFGNLVTPPWWDDLWLKEGFATWGTPLALTIMEPDGGHDLNAAARAISAMKMDSLASTRAIREPITDNNNIRNAYDAITYLKSLGVIHMVDEYFGADVFRPALGRYVEKFADGVADSPDFYRVIGDETDSPQLTETFRTFVEQKGVPLLTLTVDCNTEGNAQVHITQERYKPLGSPITDAGQQWSIPFCMRGSSGVAQCEFLTDSKQTLALSGGACPKWVMPNANGSGYYRFNMDEKQWEQLLGAFNSLNATERLSLIDSAFAAFEAGQLTPATLFEVVRLSATSDKRQVVEAPLAYLSKYSDHYVDRNHADSWHAFLRKLYSEKVKELSGKDDAESKLLNSRLLGFLALEAKDKEVRKQLQEKAERFTGFGVARDPKALDSDLYESALTVAIQDSDKSFLEHLIQVRKQIDDPLFENASANAMGRVTDPSQLHIIHDLALSDDLGPREAFGLVMNSMGSSKVQALNWLWLQENLAAIVEKIPGQWRRNTPRFSTKFCDPQELREVKILFADHHEIIPGFERALAQTEESIQLCIALKDKGTEMVDSLR